MVVAFVFQRQGLQLKTILLPQTFVRLGLQTRGKHLFDFAGGLARLGDSAELLGLRVGAGMTSVFG